MLFRRITKQIRQQGRHLFDRSIRLTTPAENPYATHVPLLIGVAAACKPKSLIEFGAGIFSTQSFLDEKVFPTLQRIESYENNKEWFEQLEPQLASNPRVKFKYVEGDMFRAVDGADTQAADMIFIDDSPSAAERVPTVEKVAQLCGSRPIVVLHDAHLPGLRGATRKFQYRRIFEGLNPQTCIMWHSHPERTVMVENVMTIIHRYMHDIPLTDIRSWKAVFAKELE